MDNMPNLKMKTALATYGHTAPLKDGTVKPRTFGFDFEGALGQATALAARQHGVCATRRLPRSTRSLSQETFVTQVTVLDGACQTNHL